MKKIILVLVGVMIVFNTFAQKIKERSVPNSVTNIFKKQYPSAKEVKWEKENLNYEVSFDLNEVENSVLYDESGKVLETEVEIKASELPASVLEYLKTNYAGQKIKETSKITAADGTITYEAEVKGKDLIFDNNGKFLKASKD